MDIIEQMARHICTRRGADPDGPITMGYPDGTSASFNPAWQGYADLAQELHDMVVGQ